jgi:hypothetical protein
MKSKVELSVIVESEETEVKNIGKLGLNKMIDLIASGYVVVDVRPNFQESIAVCVNK